MHYQAPHLERQLNRNALPSGKKARSRVMIGTEFPRIFTLNKNYLYGGQTIRRPVVKRLLFVVGILLLAAPFKAALASDDGYYMPSFQHRMDHLEHQQQHQELGEAHENAHDEGFRSQRDHRDWHQSYGAAHQDFHEEHPSTWHDHQPGFGREGNYYGYRPYSGFTWSFGR
jgi:hypothetical protein